MDKENTSDTLLVLLLVSPFMAALTGYVVFCYWGWFITPVFKAPVPALGYCIGLAMLWRFLCPSGSIRSVKKQYCEDWNILHSIIGGVFGCLMALGFGWILRHFV